MDQNGKMEAYWMKQIQGTGRYQPRDDQLHPETKKIEPDETATESQYFGLCMPRHNIHGALNLYWYPNLGTITGGIWAFKGHKPHHLACEMFDWRNHMSDKIFVDDLNDYTMISGYRMRIIEPGKKFRAHYEDPARDNRFDIEYTAIMAPFMLGSNNHFVQHMKAEGELVLRGRKYPVCDYTVRNRSWGQARSESNQPCPPITWISGVFGDDFSFYCSIFDDLAAHPGFRDKLTLPGNATLTNGFIRPGDDPLVLTGGRKRIDRDPQTLFPKRIKLDLVDERGETWTVTGKITAASCFSMWHNMSVSLCQVRWECRGRTGYGDAQDIKWGDFIYHHMNSVD